MYYRPMSNDTTGINSPPREKCLSANTSTTLPKIKGEMKEANIPTADAEQDTKSVPYHSYHVQKIAEPNSMQAHH